MQSKFMEFREARNSIETELKDKVEKLQHELDLINSGKDRSTEMARLAAETDKLSLKSSYEVRIDVLSKEKQHLIQLTQNL